MRTPNSLKNKPRTVLPPLETNFQNSTADGEIPPDEPTSNGHNLRRAKLPVRRPEKVLPPLETRSLNPMPFVEMPVDEPGGNNHILQPVKRPVGRPKGSKKKPRTLPAAIQISSDTVIDIPEGVNIVQWLLQFCCKHQVSVTVLNASGDLSNIIPDFQPNSIIPGPLPIVSLSWTVVPTPPMLAGVTNWQGSGFPFAVFLSLPDGAISSGIVARSAIAASKVNVVAITTTVLSDPSKVIPERPILLYDGRYVEDPIE